MHWTTSDKLNFRCIKKNDPKRDDDHDDDHDDHDDHDVHDVRVHGDHYGALLTDG